jgi:Mg-chelatase subunit ChlD
VDSASQVRRVALAFWGKPVQTTVLAGETHNSARAVLTLDVLDNPVLHLPPTIDSQADLPLAMAAHAAAHLRFGVGPQARAGLKPVQQVLLGVLEDARVEWLALQELPGLRAVWWPFHADAAALRSASFDDLLARLSASLLRPAHEDSHAWVARVRRMFFAINGRSLALKTPGEVRHAASVLGNDIGQMRLPFNARTYVVHARYRDDNSHLWLYAEEDRAADMLVVGEPPPSTLDRYPPPPAAPCDWQLETPVAEYPEWDHRIGRYRPRWVHVHELILRSQTSSPTLANSAPNRLVRLSQRLISQAGLGTERHTDGDELHTRATVDHAIALRLGLTPDDRVWRRPRRWHPPQAVLLLIDASVSTAAQLDIWQAEVRQAAQALQAMGHLSAIWAFGSDGRHRVRFQRLKDWTERCEQVPWGTLETGGSTRMGVALRHAVRLCAAAPGLGSATACSVLLFTDGELHDIDVHDSAYLLADLVKAAREARTRGVRLQALMPASSHSSATLKALGRQACLATTPGCWQAVLVAALTDRH